MLKPLARAEFQAIINRVVSELERAYKKRLVYLAAFGSLARAAETPLSDIDLLAIVRTGPPAAHAWLYGTTSIDVNVLPLSKVKERILRVDESWPHEVGALLKHKVYVDRAGISRRLRRWHADALRWMKKPLDPHAGFYEYFGKMERGWKARDPEVVRRAAWEIFFMSCMDLALVNRRFYVDHMKMTEEIKEFSMVPRGFVKHARNLFHSDLDVVYRAAQALLRAHLQLAKEYGYKMKSLTKIDQIKID
jgi:predicted nucleotidyltransferase